MNTGSSRRGRRGGRRRTRGGRDNANTNKQIVNDEQKTADTQIPVATPTVNESTAKPAESASPQDVQVLDKQISDSNNTTQASSEKTSEHAVKESSPVSNDVPKTTEVMPHPDRAQQESAPSNGNKNSQVSSDNSTSTDTGQSTAGSGTQDRAPERVEVATQTIAPHPDNVQSAPNEKGGDKTNINLSAGATDDERTFLDIGASERVMAGSKDSNPTETEESKN
jgi:hypothetical protein